MPTTHFGEELRRLRRQAGLTLADLADAIECSITYISDVERGRKNPPPPTAIMKLAVRLGQEVSLSRLLLLAAKSRQTVEIALKDKDERFAHMLVALARRCEEGSLTDDMVEQILQALERGEQ